VMLEDVQNRPDGRGVALDQVGTTGLRYPISVWDRDHAKQDTIAEVTMSVALPAHLKGTHLSRFIEVLDDHAGELTQRTIPAVLADLQRRLDTATAHLTVTFPYFLRRAAPISGAAALMDYACTFSATAHGDTVQFELAVRVPVTSVCPCSKAISDYGAHNQRSRVGLTIRGASDDVYPLPVRRQFDLIRGIGSTPVFPIIKRIDERVVTMRAHNNPAFAEDMARDLSAACRELGIPHEVTVRNLESIHSHDAVARLAWR